MKQRWIHKLYQRARVWASNPSLIIHSVYLNAHCTWKIFNRNFFLHFVYRKRLTRQIFNSTCHVHQSRETYRTYRQSLLENFKFYRKFLTRKLPENNWKIFSI